MRQACNPAKNIGQRKSKYFSRFCPIRSSLNHLWAQTPMSPQLICHLSCGCTLDIHPKRTRQGKPKLVLLHQGCRQLCTILHPACNPRRWEDKGSQSWFFSVFPAQSHICSYTVTSISFLPGATFTFKYFQGIFLRWLFNIIPSQVSNITLAFTK